MNSTPKVRQKTFGVFFMSIEKRGYRHHSMEEKERAVALYRQGYGSRTIGKQLNIDARHIQRWIDAYNAYGADSFDKRKNANLTYEQKKVVVREVLEKSLSCDRASLKYLVSVSSVKSWVTQVRNNGYTSLAEIKPPGRPPKDMGRPKKKEPQTEQERMEEELRYLRAENAYLKKLRALVEERVARESGKSPEPSKR